MKKNILILPIVAILVIGYVFYTSEIKVDDYMKEEKNISKLTVLVYEDNVKYILSNDKDIIENIESYVEEIYDYYDLLMLDEKLDKIKMDGKVYIVTYENFNSINVPAFNLEIKCKSIIIPLYTDLLPEDIVIVLDEEDRLKAYATTSDSLD